MVVRCVKWVPQKIDICLLDGLEGLWDSEYDEAVIEGERKEALTGVRSEFFRPKTGGFL